MQAAALGAFSADVLCQDISPVELDYYFSLLFCHTLFHVWDPSLVTEKRQKGFTCIKSIILRTGEKKGLCWFLFGKKVRSYIILIEVALAIYNLYISQNILTFIWSIWLLACALLLLEYLQYAHGFIRYNNFFVLSMKMRLNFRLSFRYRKDRNLWSNLFD